MDDLGAFCLGDKGGFLNRKCELQFYLGGVENTFLFSRRHDNNVHFMFYEDF